jgi:hypothetical protein
LEEGDPVKSPWFDVAALRRQGALVVSTSPLPAETLIGGQLTDVEQFDRPMMRGAMPEAVFFGEWSAR